MTGTLHLAPSEQTRSIQTVLEVLRKLNAAVLPAGSDVRNVAMPTITRLRDFAALVGSGGTEAPSLIPPSEHATQIATVDSLTAGQFPVAAGWWSTVSNGAFSSGSDVSMLLESDLPVVITGGGYGLAGGGALSVLSANSPITCGSWTAGALATVIPAYLESTEEQQASSESLLRSVLLEIFPCAQISSGSHTDPEEGWSRPILTIETGIIDFDERFAREQQFYSAVRKDPGLMNALRGTSVMFEWT